MISFKRELFYFVIDSYIKSLYFRLQLLSQEALEDFGLCIFPNLSNRLVSDLSYSFPFQIHIFCDFSQSDMGDAYSIEFSDDFLFSFIQCGDAVLQVVHHLLEYGALVCYQGIFVDQNVE
mgnify:FL=1